MGFTLQSYSQQLTTFSGEAEYNISPINVIPNSPDVTSWIQNVHTEVSLSTGTVNYKIPIYKFLNKKINLPIEISYNSNGIKVSQLSSIVGLGWNMNVGGFISRSIEGQADEMTGYAVPPAGTDYESVDWQNYIAGMASGYGDNMPDRYTYSIEGINGTFIIENLAIKKLEDNNLKIEGDVLEGFILVGPSGNKYYYQVIENTKSVNSCNPTNKLFNPTSYMLSRIVDVSGKEIHFQYTAVSYSFQGNVVQTGTKLISKDPALEQTSIVPEHYPMSSCITTNVVNGFVLSGITSTEGEQLIFNYIDRQDIVGNKQLAEIQIKSGTEILKRIKFYCSYITPSSEFSSTYSPTNDKRMFLDSLDFLDGQNSNPERYRFSYERKDKICATASFSQDHLGYFNGRKNTTLIPNQDNQHIASQWGIPQFGNRIPQFNYAVIGQLNKIQFPAGGVDSIVYEPHYVYSHKSDACTPLQLISLSGESEFKQTATYQGTLSVQANLQDLKVHYACTPVGDIEYDREYYSVSLTIRDMNNVVRFSEAAWKGDIKDAQLSLAAGTYSVVLTIKGACWGNAEFSGCMPPAPTPEGFKNEIGGVRVKGIYHNDKGNVKESKTYEYGDYGGASIVANPLPFYQNIFIRYFYYNAGTQYYFPAQFMELTSFSFYDYPQYSGSYISYSRVKENFVRQGENGRIEHKYNVSLDQPAQIALGNPIPNVALSNFGLHTGLEYYTGTFDANDKLIEEKFYYYNHVASQTKSKDYYIFSNRSSTVVRNTYNKIMNVDVNKYTLFSKWNVLDSVTTKTYFDNQSKVSTERVSYSYLNVNHKLPSQITKTDSKNEVSQTYYLYPQDYATGNAILDTMISNNILVAPVEIVYGKIKSGTLNVLAGKYTSYLAGGKGEVDKNYQFESALPISLAGFKFSNKNLGVLPFTGASNLPVMDSKYKIAQIFSRYDGYGNPVEIQSTEKSPPIIYLWGYGGKYPIAEIKNATYAEVLAVLGQTTINNLNALTVSEATINTAMNTLRTHASLSKAMVTSYTYKPLVGMTSKTDARVVTEYYEYDGMQRLKTVLDQFKYINTAIDYHYKAN
ncbi:hypothetical protein LZQ00_09290 [Sphingobacterium sp. SRCM116780]|uniref:hypothetical protein n=1 Tax=Sphingobacterium sp. SRCM116780 TaxID=2907623 RepID=UPI001F38926A|nr:hypothetical protein [Sphingobacterium sp. SRCM116780]UIR57995.1 hypothetical protein LZQ00_09290 [Sphingobacterium sp. SRCM116780]